MDNASFVSEVYHRVKNNLQMICSMLRMQMRETESVFAKESLSEAIRRIASLSISYDLMSTTGSVSLRLLLKRILEDHVAFSLMPGQRIEYDVEGDDLTIPSSVNPVHLSVVVSELVMNAIKHGFCYSRDGKILISYHRDGTHMVIEVTDNGVGISRDFSFHLGLKIVNEIVKNDMEGEFCILPLEDSGTKVILRIRWEGV